MFAYDTIYTIQLQYGRGSIQYNQVTDVGYFSDIAVFFTHICAFRITFTG